MKTKFSLPLAVEAIIPHRKPVCMINRLMEFTDQGGTVEAIVSIDNVLVDSDGWLDPLATAEMIAQAYASVKGYDDLLSGRSVKQGYLVGIRKIQFLGNAFTGDHLQISVKTVAVVSDFAVVEGEVKRNQEVLAKGEIKLWIQEDNPSGL